MEIITKSAEETKKFGREFAASLKPGSVVAFVGGLGAGKTTFIQGMAEGLGVADRVISPTFIIMRSYEPSFYHVDLYRLEENAENEAVNLGLMDLISRGKSIIAIEWAERIKSLLPRDTIWIKIEELEGGRKIII